jgi:hypothetical protein
MKLLVTIFLLIQYRSLWSSGQFVFVSYTTPMPRGVSSGTDAEKALVFIRENLAKQVKKALQPHRVPIFEASYGPAQKDHFAR